jgi:hypothetical protein
MIYGKASGSSEALPFELPGVAVHSCQAPILNDNQLIAPRMRLFEEIHFCR